jgi:hypothetical protein
MSSIVSGFLTPMPSTAQQKFVLTAYAKVVSSLAMDRSKSTSKSRKKESRI